MRSTGNRQKSSCVGRKVAQTNHLGQRLWSGKSDSEGVKKKYLDFYLVFKGPVLETCLATQRTSQTFALQNSAKKQVF